MLHQFSMCAMNNETSLVDRFLGLLTTLLVSTATAEVMKLVNTHTKPEVRSIRDDFCEVT